MFKTMQNIPWLLWLVFAVHFVANQSQDVSIDSICNQAQECGECMQAHSQCRWCLAEEYPDTLYGRSYRCATLDTLKMRGCAVDKIDASQTEMGDIVMGQEQLVPSEQTVYLRPNAPYLLNLTYNQVKDYPVDLYYLTDISYSMKDDIATVSSLANVIAQSMSNVTRQFRMGFGGFVDKPLFPFVTEDRTKEPCKNTGYSGNSDCHPPYVLRHFLSPTSDPLLFQQTTGDVPMSGNIDAPEGGLDALMQVALCPKVIGWSNHSRKIVLFSTDGFFHVGGDGRLAGLLAPPPVECQLRMATDRNKPSLQYMGYHDSIFYDYPSVAEVARVLDAMDISVIFGVIGNNTDLYSRLAKTLPVAAVGAVGEKSENIVKLIQENYQKIASTVTFSVDDDYDQDLLKVEVLTRCHGQVTFSEGIEECLNHLLGHSIDFKLRIEAKKCFSGEQRLKFSIKGVGHASVRVKTACECPSCKSQPSPYDLPKSPKCNGQGHFACGRCYCVPGISGEFCECGASGGKTEEELLQQCRVDPFNSKLVCSGHGRCECGKCKCHHPRYQGEFCQCDMEGCPQSQDTYEVCGGELRGRCQCNGTCSCLSGYKDRACDCMVSDEKCYNSTSSLICGGTAQGRCYCGMCRCVFGWTGEQCDIRMEDNMGLCQDENVVACVLCTHTHLAHNSTKKCSHVCDNLPSHSLQLSINKERPTAIAENIISCWAKKGDCEIKFFYWTLHDTFQKRRVRVWILEDPICKGILNIVFIVLGVILAVILIGVFLLLLYKLVMTIDEKREFAQFQKEDQNAAWEMEENPIFKPPVTVVQNPTYKD